MKYIAILLTIISFNCTAEKKNSYSTPETPWPENLGNHRAVLDVSEPADAVEVSIDWRRHDRNPEEKKFVIIHESGDTVKNITRIYVDNEGCHLVFGPAEKAGKYFFYYLPYEVQEEYGSFNKRYLKPEVGSKKSREEKFEISSLPKAKLVGFQSRTAFDSFYPMEIVALQSEKDSLLSIHKNDFLIFPEDRKFPIRMLDEIPQKWVESGPSNQFKGEAQKNEYYAFQLGIFAVQKDLKDLKIQFSSLKNGDAEIPVSGLTCFNTGGIDPYGKPFVKQVNVEKGKLQPLWIGVDIPEDTQPGNYRGTVNIFAENSESQTVEVILKIGSEVLADRGDNEPWRHSRLRWLNSTLGIDDNPTKQYQPISYLGESTYGFTGKKLTMSDNGFPGSINVKGIEILNHPISFVVETTRGKEQFSEPKNEELLKNEPGVISRSYKSYSENMEICGIGIIEADGFLNFKLKIKALNSVKTKDIRLEIPFKTEVAKYIMGMDLPGTAIPKSHDAKWNGPHDSFWIGNAHAGLWCELRGTDYSGPLLNLYHPEYPSSWFNDDKGGFKIESTNDEVKAIVYSGSRDLEKGEELTFEWSMLITPVKDIDYKSQFTDRYYHTGGAMPTNEDLKNGVKIVNLHHANNYNPHINYPFIAVDSMKWFVDQLHQNGQKVKIYYTIRELTNYTTEIWALRSLGGEILGNGPGGGYPWLREHLISGYRQQWYQWFPDKSADASIVNAPGDSRWYNYYIAGLEWLVKNVDIDGLYLDDVSYDRRTVKRIRKVLDNTKPGCLLDLHSNTGFSKGPAIQYAEYFPYIDKLWFGESFQYDKMSPENWLVEVSGIPFGLMGDMLQGGGNRWLGMLFGMTARLPWTSADPRPVWKIWDEFGIDSAKMIGYWQKDCPIRTNNSDILATVYQKEGKSLISVASWSDKPASFSFQFDWQVLEIDPTKAIMIAPEIKDFQQAKTFQINDSIPIEPKKGWLLYLCETDR